VTVLFPTDVLN